MGPLRPRTIKNTGVRDEPVHEARIRDYAEFLNGGGEIQSTERITVCIRGGGIAMITSLPEKLKKKCTRMGISYKMGDVTIIVDMLIKVTDADVAENHSQVGSVDYVKNSTGKMLHRTLLISDLVLPADLRSASRDKLITSEMLAPEQRVRGMNVYRLQLCDIDLLRERETEIFCNREM
jgi:hypothetical protein